MTDLPKPKIAITGNHDAGLRDLAAERKKVYGIASEILEKRKCKPSPGAIAFGKHVAKLSERWYKAAKKVYGVK